MKKTNLKHAAISPRVPGSFTGRKVSTLLEEAALIRANQLKQKEKEVVLMKAEKKEIEVKDINAAAFVKHKVVSPTISMKGDTINFVCPDNYSTKLCLEVYKANPSIAMAESVDALRMLKAQIAAMRKSDHQEKDANGEE